jgi:uncharacterized integral membrane protein
MKPRIIIILLLVILAIVFIVQNTQVVSMKFLVLLPAKRNRREALSQVVHP